jgi:ABC-type nickel/cobalt efflux system permease component RcnA
MNIKWSSLGEVAVVSLAVGVAIVVIFAVGVLAWSLRERATAEGGASGGTAGNTPLLTVAAGLCFLACAAIIAYGIYLIVPQFH